MPTSNLLSPVSRCAIISEFCKLVVPVLLICSLALFIHYLVEVQSRRNQLLLQEVDAVENTRDLINRRLKLMSQDVVRLTDVVSQQYDSNHQLNLIALSDYLTQIARFKPSYQQIRFLDATGQEQVRVNRFDNEVLLTSSDNLQNKSERYYFKETISLPQNSVYTSALDLNVEEGKIQPENPTLRVASPVYSSSGHLLGVVVVNYDGRSLISQLRYLEPQSKSLSQGKEHPVRQLIIINSQGQALINLKGEQLQFIFEDFSIPAEQPLTIWPLLNISTEGQFQTNLGLVTFVTLPVSSGRYDESWKVAYLRESKDIDRLGKEFLTRNGFFYGVILFSLLIGGGFTARYRLKHRRSESVREYERNFRQVLENLQQCAVIVDKYGRLVFCNDYFLRLTGHTRSDILNCVWTETFIPAEIRDKANIEQQKRLDSGSHQSNTEDTLLTKAGAELTISWTETLNFDDDGYATAITYIGEDVTEHRKAQEQLLLLGHVVEQSSSSVMITDTSGLIIYTNPAFTSLTGYSAEEVKGLSPKFLQSGHYEESDYQDMWKQLSSGHRWYGSFHNLRKNGERYWEKAIISPVKNQDNETLYYVAVKQDISEQKRLEEEIRVQVQEKAKNDQLAAVGQMANMIAHDLRNPLCSVKMAIQMEHRKLSPRAPNLELLDLSLQQIQYMEQILEDLLSFSRTDKLTLEWLDFNDLVVSVLNHQQKIIQENDITVVLDLQKSLPTIQVDSVKLRQVLQNLIVNAIQATECSSFERKIKISSEFVMTDNGYKVAFSLTNNGKSIDGCMRLKVFEPFFTTRAKGTGLGLSIVKRLIQQHSGQVNISPLSNDAGTVVRFSLPLGQQAPVELNQNESLAHV